METFVSSLLPTAYNLPVTPRTTATVTAIIAMHKKGSQLDSLLDVLSKVPYIREVFIMVGRSERREILLLEQISARYPNARVVQTGAPLGKGQSILAGWRAAQSPYILLLDPDLMDLAPHHVVDLIEPVVEDRADMTVGLFQHGSWLSDYAHKAAPWLSGQRCLKGQLLNELSLEAAQGYGIETALTASSRQFGRRIQQIHLNGVSHSAAGVGRGLVRSLSVRLRMVAQVSRAMAITKDWRLLFQGMRLEVRLLFIFVLLLVISSLAFNRSRAASHLTLDDLDLLDIHAYSRILVVSPHPDDETLGAGGLIRTALERGSQVKVVMMTNGDGQVLAPLALDRRVLSSGQHYVAHGQRRQVETLLALEELGLHEEDVYFLGYPDRGLLELWLKNWQKDCPVRAVYTRVSTNPYLNSYNQSATYCGSDLLADLQQIITRFTPDLIVLPHPNDDHADHRATGSFARMALAKAAADLDAYRPDVVGYLIHYGYFPQPRGYNTHKPLLPPIPLSEENNTWLKLDLAPEAVQAKDRALQRYATQMKLLGKFLPSFVRPNEIYLALSFAEVLPVDYSPLPLHETGVKKMPRLGEPASATSSLLVLSGADLVGWKITRLGSQLILTADIRGTLLPGFQYKILVKTPQGDTYVFRYQPEEKVIAPRSFSAYINLSDLGDPEVLAFAAEVQQGVTLDRTGWYFIELQNWIP